MKRAKSPTVKEPDRLLGGGEQYDTGHDDDDPSVQGLDETVDDAFLEVRAPPAVAETVEVVACPLLGAGHL